MPNKLFTGSYKFKLRLFLILTGVIFSLLALQSAYADKVISLEELLKYPDKFDGQKLTVEGEAIGNLLKGDSGYWINISSGGQALGIFASNKEAFVNIHYWGEYSAKGDLVQIQGLFYKSCPLHHLMDIHLEKIEIIKEGYRLTDSVSLFKIDLAILLFTICLVASTIYFIKFKIWNKKLKI
ncbi:MAG: hypothetical protein KBB01_00950 [Candidatus Omnitrophica bacterium]|jgi:hypothetical protein|nr:hypothetical protein [Candidatus Omnitrophota bacterium]